MNDIMGSMSTTDILEKVASLSPAETGDFLSALPSNIASDILDNMSSSDMANLSDSVSPAALGNMVSGLEYDSDARVITSKIAAYPSRIPRHEPWGRTDTKSDNDMSPKYDYDSIKKDETRNKYWKR